MVCIKDINPNKHNRDALRPDLVQYERRDITDPNKTYLWLRNRCEDMLHRETENRNRQAAYTTTIPRVPSAGTQPDWNKKGSGKGGKKGAGKGGKGAGWNTFQKGGKGGGKGDQRANDNKPPPKPNKFDQKIQRIIDNYKENGVTLTVDYAKKVARGPCYWRNEGQYQNPLKNVTMIIG